MIPPALFCLAQDYFGHLDLLWSHTNFKIVYFIHVKNVIDILIEIELKYR
jgi:hypothetical protein